MFLQSWIPPQPKRILMWWLVICVTSFKLKIYSTSDHPGASLSVSTEWCDFLCDVTISRFTAFTTSEFWRIQFFDSASICLERHTAWLCRNSRLEKCANPSLTGVEQTRDYSGGRTPLITPNIEEMTLKIKTDQNLFLGARIVRRRQKQKQSRRTSHWCRCFNSSPTFLPSQLLVMY